jgi:hypothetical protein
MNEVYMEFFPGLKPVGTKLLACLSQSLTRG